MSAIYHGVNGAFRGALKNLFEYGDAVGPRGLQTKELIGVSFTIADIENNVITISERAVNPYFLMAEMCWILGGESDVGLLEPYMPSITKYYDPGHTFGAYGPRFVQQLPYVLDTLARDPETRQAVMTFWRPCLWQENRRVETRDVPCTVSLQFIQRDGALHLVVYMRSNDIWKGFTYDVFNFTQIQKYVAGRACLQLGTYTHVCGSLHLYDSDRDKAERVLDTYPPSDFKASDTTGPRLHKTNIGRVAFGDLLRRYARPNDKVKNDAIMGYWGMSDPTAEIADILVRKHVDPDHTIHDAGWRRLMEVHEKHG